MGKNIIIIAAPFGYGPAVKALLVAEGLAKVAKVTIFSDREAYQFVEKYKQPGVLSREGVFSLAFDRQADLEKFDRFICVNNEPAVHFLIKRGLASRVIFIDSLLPWRAAMGSMRFAEKILGYLVQDYPGAAGYLGECRAARVELVAPMVWGNNCATRPAGGKQPLLLHLGGATSPLVNWMMVREAIKELVAGVGEIAGWYGRNLLVIGSSHLGSLRSEVAGAVEIRADVCPDAAAALISSAELVLTTPGLGTIYEALTCGTPCLLLPPMNSTQLSQYRVFVEAGFPGLVAPGELAGISRATAGLGWDKQTAYVVGWLNSHCRGVVDAAGVWLNKVLAEATGERRLAALVANQHDFRARLSRVAPGEVIRALVVD